MRIALARRVTPASISRLLRSAALLVAAGLAPATVTADEAPGSDSESGKAQREARLGQMRERAKDFEVIVPGQKEPVRLRADPLFRYSDQPRGFVDATLWGWVMKGRPAVIAKAEMAQTPGGDPYWQFCVASLADGPLDIRLVNGRRLAVNKPGLVLRPFDSAPEPGARPAERLRQMKELIARFTATIHVDGKESLRQEMRLLPSPMHRYADGELRDGVIFALTTNGTNPDMLIVVELRAEKGAEAAWYYGIVKMTYAEVHIRLDNFEVWKSPVSEPLETWTYFSIPRPE
jgi:hypothetical protein